MSNESSDRSTAFSDSVDEPVRIREEHGVDPTTGTPIVNYVYEYPPRARAFRFEHDAAAGVFRLTSAEGKTEVFRDQPARYLCVEPDETGAMRPVTKLGRPVYLYLSREEREVR